MSRSRRRLRHTRPTCSPGPSRAAAPARRTTPDRRSRFAARGPAGRRDLNVHSRQLCNRSCYGLRHIRWHLLRRRQWCVDGDLQRPRLGQRHRPRGDPAVPAGLRLCRRHDGMAGLRRALSHLFSWTAPSPLTDILTGGRGRLLGRGRRLRRRGPEPLGPAHLGPCRRRA